MSTRACSAWQESPSLEGTSLSLTDVQEINRCREELKNATAAVAKAQSWADAAQKAYIDVLERSVGAVKRGPTSGRSRSDEPGAKRACTGLNPPDGGRVHGSAVSCESMGRKL
jgi:hypothetical protein